MRNSSILILFLLSIISTNTYSETLRISPEQLNKQINDKQLIILDVRSKNDYDVGHIKSAINFPVNLTYSNLKTNGQIQQPVQMQKYFRKAGINIKSNVIVYDGGQLVDAARVFWSLEVYGLKNVKVLDHGFNYWLDKNLPTSQETPKIKESHYVSTINNQRLSSKFATQLALNNSKKLIIDARSLSAYKGETSVAKRFGHIPSAINVPFFHNITKDSNFKSLKPITELKKLYSDIPIGKKVIIYCKIGRVSSTNYFALRELGHDVSNYDASWREWGNDDTLPIEK